MSALTARVRAVLAASTADHLTADHPLVLLAACVEEIERLEAESANPDVRANVEALRHYRAVLISVSATLCPPVSERDVEKCRQMMAPLYQDALLDMKARRVADLAAIRSDEANDPAAVRAFVAERFEPGVASPSTPAAIPCAGIAPDAPWAPKSDVNPNEAEKL